MTLHLKKAEGAEREAVVNLANFLGTATFGFVHNREVYEDTRLILNGVLAFAARNICAFHKCTEVSLSELLRNVTEALAANALAIEAHDKAPDHSGTPHDDDGEPSPRTH